MMHPLREVPQRRFLSLRPRRLSRFTTAEYATRRVGADRDINRRKGRVFDSETDRLTWLIDMVKACTSDTTLSAPKAEDLELFKVTASWLTRCFDLAKGLATLVQQELYAPACVLHRTVWELWIDWRYLLRTSGRRVNAAKVLLCAQIEALELIDAHPEAFDEAYRGALRSNLGEFEARHPKASAVVRRQRRRGRFHWSGLSYSKMERGLGGNFGIYGPLSWEAHGTVTAMRDVRLEVGDNVALFQFGQSAEVYRPNFLLYSAGGVLFYIYNDLADMWGLPAIELPKVG